MHSDLPKRNHPRLHSYDYSSSGHYFVTMCIKDRRNLLGKIPVGRDVLIAPDRSGITDLPMPSIQLSNYGEVALKHIIQINRLKPDVYVDKYVIMPNHIHMIVVINNIAVEGSGSVASSESTMKACGAMKTSRPTSKSLSSVIRSYKTMITKEIGVSIWQTSYYDHVIRDYGDYLRIWQYIDENPAKWSEDRYYLQ